MYAKIVAGGIYMKLSEKEVEIVEILEKDARIPMETLAKMVELTVEETEAIVKRLEETKVIVQYAALVDWRKVDGHEGVTAMIDVKVTPKRGVGFDEVAERIYRFPEVKSVYLMSGAYDLSVVIEGRSMSEVAQFVSEKLSTLDSVISTTTHFILKKYKHDGTVFDQGDQDRRIVVSP
jgi:DNA-binding Lrp family transcriptional regulator